MDRRIDGFQGGNGSQRARNAKVGSSNSSSSSNKKSNDDFGGEYEDFDDDTDQIVNRLKNIRRENNNSILEQFDDEREIDSQKRISEQDSNSYSFGSEKEKRDELDNLVHHARIN